jgi:hypothetical protein
MFQGLKTSNGLLWSRDTTDTFEYAMGCEVVGIEFDGLQTLEARLERRTFASSGGRGR